MGERKRITDQARSRRQELADEFQHTIGDVKEKMDAHADERMRLVKENDELKNKFRHFFEQYDKREKEIHEKKRERELEGQKLKIELKLSEQTQLYRQEAKREAACKHENDELTNTDQVLRGQLQTYTTKYNHFQDALSKSDKVLGQQKRRRNTVQQQVEVVGKENQELQVRNERRITQVSKERDESMREKDRVQETCKLLQNARQQLLKQVQELQDGISQ